MGRQCYSARTCQPEDLRSESLASARAEAGELEEAKLLGGLKWEFFRYGPVISILLSLVPFFACWSH